METRSWIVVATLLGVYLLFWLWYGGRGEPLTEAELAGFREELASLARENDTEPDSELLEAFASLAATDDGREFYMVNLMRFRERARYPEDHPLHGETDPLAADARYGRAVVPELLRRASLPILVARWQGTFLQPEGADTWDRVGVVRYRSRRDLLEMALALSRSGSGIHKWASMEKTQVFPTEPMVDLVFVRGAVAVLLTGLGVAIIAVLRRLAPRPA